MEDSSKNAAPPESTYILADRDYSEIVHLENPSLVERIVSRSRTEAVAYIGRLLQSGIPRYILAGPKVAFTALCIEALSDFSREVSAWREAGTIPEDFAGREWGRQTWVELLTEIDSNPSDSERLKAMKAMFLAANRINVTDGESILAYQLFQIAKNLNSGPLLLLKANYQLYLAYVRGARTGGSTPTQTWRTTMAANVGHKLAALVAQDERKLVEQGLIAPWIRADELEVPAMDARMTDLGIKFCENIESYSISVNADSSD
jgi:hypothetical protein